jgi:RepB DNA-primase N-terminal domain
MVCVDRAAPIRFLRTAYDAADWIAVFLKTCRTGDVAQRVLPVATLATARFQSWLRHRNANGWNVYVSVNAIQPGRSREKRSIAAIRHVFLDEDADGPGLLAALITRPDLPPPSYVLHSSPARIHVFWRVRDFSCEHVESLQKRLAVDFGTDSVATSCAQTTRLPGFINHKYERAVPVFIEYLRPRTVLTPEDFPIVTPGRYPAREERALKVSLAHTDRMQRARRFLAWAEPAIAGNRGDPRTFRICCRVVRGFQLSDDEALCVLQDWNARCVPPWTERELWEKVQNARKYGHEPYGGLLLSSVPRFTIR